MMRPFISNGWVFWGSGAPVEASRTCATNVVELMCCTARENAAVLEGGHGLLVEHGRAVGLVVAETGAVGVDLALDGEAVRRLQQPEAGVHAMRGGGESDGTCGASSHTAEGQGSGTRRAVSMSTARLGGQSELPQEVVASAAMRLIVASEALSAA